MNEVIYKIKKVLKPFVKNISNKKVRGFIIYLHNKSSELIFRSAVMKYYKNTDSEKIDPEKKAVLNFLKTNPFNLFPYDFIKKYKRSDIKIFTDKNNGLKYGLLDGKKLYFKRSCTEKEAQNIFSGLILEQDLESPHRYLNNTFDVSSDDIVVDIGAAEGDFALSIVDKVKKIYIFEADFELIESLQATFEPWKEKIIIVNKYVSNTNKEQFTTLDSFFEDKEMPTFFKVDIEGAELDMIYGSNKILSTTLSTKVVMATYHKHDDEMVLGETLRKLGFHTEFSKGYMLSTWDGVIKAPFFRRALIRAIKQ